MDLRYLCGGAVNSSDVASFRTYSLSGMVRQLHSRHVGFRGVRVPPPRRRREP